MWANALEMKRFSKRGSACSPCQGMLPRDSVASHSASKAIMHDHWGDCETLLLRSDP